MQSSNMSNEMNEMEQIVIQIAENCKRPGEFIYRLEESFKVPPDKKGDFFLQVGLILYKFSYFRLALNSWNHALEYFLENGERTGESICYGNLGTAYYHLGEFKKAIEYHEKSLKITKEIGDRAGETVSFGYIGISYYHLGEFRKAIEYYRKSLEINKEIGDRAGESMCYGNLGTAYKNLGEFRKAIKYHEKSLGIDKEIGDKHGESKCYTNLGLAYYNLGEFKKAIEYHEKSLEINKEIGNRAGESKCYTNLGLAYRNLGEFRKAIKYHEKSLEIDKEAGDRLGESKCYTNLGITYDSMGGFRKAIRYYEESLEIIKEIGDRSGESACYTNLGLAYHSLGEFRKALEYHEKSLEITEEIGNRAGESKCYANIGLAYRGLGEFRKAIKYYERSLKIDGESGDKYGESKCYTNLGAAYRSLGEFRKAIEYHEKSLEANKEIGDRAGESKCYTNFGLIYYNLGDYKKAIEYYKKSLKITKEIGDRAEESKCYGNLGISHYNLGEFRKAIEFYKKSLKIAKEIGDRSGESSSYTNLGIFYNSTGNFRKAIKYYERSLKIDKESGDRYGESVCYANIGLAYHGLGNSSKTVEYYKKSLKIIQEIGDVNSERIANLNLCRMYYESEKERAYEYCKRSIELSEMIGGGLVEEEKKIMFSTQTFNAYHYMVPLCLDIGKEKEAFSYTERSKSRAFLDLLAATKIKPTYKITSNLQQLLDNEEVNLARIREIQMRHLKQIEVPAEPGEVDKIFENLTQIYNKIEQFDSEYVFTRKGTPLSVDDLQSMLSSQEKDTVLIEFFITEEKTFIFVISSREHQLHIKTIPLSIDIFNQYLVDWRKIAISLDRQRMSRYLIEPVSEYLTEGDLIYFVPFGPLHYFPLHALTVNGEPLIRSHPVAYLPTASLIQFCRKKGTGTLQSCASFGMDFEEEAKKVAALFDAEAYLDDLVTKEKIETCNRDIIHLSCHGLFDDKDPLSSRVLLHDGELTARDIFDMRLTTELVTLSGCETGYNERRPGDELIGLTRAFLYAGAPSVVVSLWPVIGPSARELMLEFYTQLKKGKDKATALQRAQIKTMETEKYSHPFYWAPFILIGKWK